MLACFIFHFINKKETQIYQLRKPPKNYFEKLIFSLKINHNFFNVNMPNIINHKNQSINNDSIANKVIEGSEFKNIDFRMLRSFRVLRPLKLVSRTPSKYIPNNNNDDHTNI